MSTGCARAGVEGSGDTLFDEPLTEGEASEPARRSFMAFSKRRSSRSCSSQTSQPSGMVPNEETVRNKRWGYWRRKNRSIYIISEVHIST